MFALLHIMQRYRERWAVCMWWNGKRQVGMWCGCWYWPVQPTPSEHLGASDVC